MAKGERTTAQKKEQFPTLLRGAAFLHLLATSGHKSFFNSVRPRRDFSFLCAGSPKRNWKDKLYRLEDVHSRGT